MPELPEVETTRRTLLPARGAKIMAVVVRRASVVVGPRDPAALLVGRRITKLERHGKQLLLQTGADGPCVLVHLGMTGSLLLGDGKIPARGEKPAKHLHVAWELDDGRRIEFRDPRRFGGVWTFPDPQTVHQERWARLGPDATRITPAELFPRLHRAHRPLKAALLDQTLIAGLGNIYVDELLFACGIAPRRSAHGLKCAEVENLVAKMRDLLRRAIAARGSTVRDYTDGRGRRGNFQLTHHVYGRDGQPCHACAATLRAITLAGRTTVYCPQCQSARPRS